MIPTANILVVDDDPLICKQLKKVLTHDGHQVLTVQSGEAALEHIAAQEFDVALIDLKLKGIGGMKVLDTLRQQSPTTVAIILTGHATLETVSKALRQGAHDYLFKPCRAKELRKSVRDGLLRRQEKLHQHRSLPQQEPSK
jgi:DNA-binding NtrC family response regulator